MQTVRKNARVIKLLMKLNIKKAMMYRKSFLFTMLTSVIWLGVPLVTFRIIYLSVDTIAGWSWAEMVFLVGYFQIIDALVMSLMITNMGSLENDFDMAC